MCWTRGWPDPTLFTSVVKTEHEGERHVGDKAHILSRGMMTLSLRNVEAPPCSREEDPSSGLRKTVDLFV